MNKKIVLVGSGSQYTEFFLQEIFKFEEFKGCTLALVDRNNERRETVMGIAKNLNELLDWDVTIEGSADRKEVLGGAAVVYSFIAVDSIRTWKEDFKICEKHGVTQFECQTTGIGGLSEAIRHVPPVLDLCADMERLCPDAWLVLDNNPLAKIQSAVVNHTKIKVVGYCYGHELVEMALEQILDMTERGPEALKLDPVDRELMCPAGNLNIKQVGVNHMVWLLDVRDTITGEDLYPILRKRLDSMDISDIPAGYRYCTEMYKNFGYFASPADNHVADYAWINDDDIIQRCGLYKFPVDKWFGGRDKDAWDQVAKKISGKESAQEFARQRRSGWMSTQISRYMLNGLPKFFPTINVMNNGAVSNLSDNIIVEVPGVIGPDFVKAINMGPIPEHLTPVCELHGIMSNMAGNAAALGSKELALQYLLYDPKIASAQKAKAILEDILALNRNYDTRF